MIYFALTLAALESPDFSTRHQAERLYSQVWAVPLLAQWQPKTPHGAAFKNRYYARRVQQWEELWLLVCLAADDKRLKPEHVPLLDEWGLRASWYCYHLPPYGFEVSRHGLGQRLQQWIKNGGKP